MESRKDIILVITHTIALTTGFLCGYYINNKLKSSNEENLATNSGVYYCDVFDDKGKPQGDDENSDDDEELETMNAMRKNRKVNSE